MRLQRAAVAAALLTGGLVPVVLAGAGPAAATAPSLCAPPADTVGPAVTLATFGRPTLDLDADSRVQTVTLTASDTSGSGAPSGVAQVRVGIRGNAFSTEFALTLTSGAPAAGQWSGQFTVSKYAKPGTYRISSIVATDAARNEQDYFGNGKTATGPNDLALFPADSPTFTVTGTPAQRRTPPSNPLRAFSLRPQAVNTVETTRPVRIAARFAGPRPARVSVQLIGSGHRRKVGFVFVRATLHRAGGAWSGTAHIPRWVGKQILQPTLYINYSAAFLRSFRVYTAQQLHHLDFPSGLPVVSGLDTTKPTLKSLAFSPAAVDSTAGAEKVTVTATASDTGSGVKYIDVDSAIRHGLNGSAAGSYPFAADGVGYLSSEDFHVRLSRTANGDFVGTTTVPQCVPSGTYHLTVDVVDAAGNANYYSPKQLAAAGLVSSLDVTSLHGDVVAPFVYSAATYGADQELFLNFSEGVKNVTTSTLSVFATTPLSTRFTTPAPISSITCANGSATVDCSGSGGLVTSAVLTVPSLTPGTVYDVYANLNQVTTQLTDGNGNPLSWNYPAGAVKDS